MTIEQVLPNVYIKKSGNSYRTVYPVKKDLDKPFSLNNIHWKNLLLGGSWGNFFSVIFVILLILFMSYSYARDTKECRYLLENPPICVCRELPSSQVFNFSELSKLIVNKEGNNATEFDPSLYT